MSDKNQHHIDAETIETIGLRLTDTPLTAEPAVTTPVYRYPHLENVYVMETDLYGNPLPKDRCFLAFNGPHGLIGKDLKVETLKRSSVKEIEQLVQHHNEG